LSAAGVFLAAGVDVARGLGVTTGVEAGVGVRAGGGAVFAFDDRDRVGVGDGRAAVFVLAGIGTRTTPPSGGMNWLPVFGSTV
jgi:hypothetical protein